MSDPLLMWTIDDHPLDFPDHYVARLYHVDSAGARPTSAMLASDSLEVLRQEMTRKGLTCLTRMDGDDPKIIETWF